MCVTLCGRFVPHSGCVRAT
ncbi:hypothetical protein [Robinsoniella sp. RHS]